jgi:hypothetical protein
MQSGTIRALAQSPPPITFPARTEQTRTGEFGLLKKDCCQARIAISAPAFEAL